MSSIAVPRVRRRRDRVNIALQIWGILVYSFLFLPILVIVFYSFNSGRVLLEWNGFGLQGYRTGVQNDVILNAVKTSVAAAAGTAIIATILGTVAVFALVGLAIRGAARRNRRITIPVAVEGTT